MSAKLVILDRDGVINQDSDDYVKSLDEWIAYPAAIEAIARLHRAGWQVAVATNQSGIARGYYDENVLAGMHQHMLSLVHAAGGELAHIAYCPHGPDDDCQCRKPLPGMLHEIRQALDLPSLEGSWMVGDSLRDIQAGEAAGCHQALVLTGKGERTLEKHPEIATSSVGVFPDLAAFADWLLSPSSA
ncbi:D-glycero-beta-D-manno-heptose 1,7-bisphosphate 7-phosphatase [Halomonas eurihalina]|uniref:D,D-heptose 1,7-bisphosphate phosphatase n=1 Tax=Halomonas eurihalina TaxID=42566 RepID=A0A5D9CUN0_HALER|nr:D-glycero-beta-D-manno-heptose 1,7-bisphosphate 7-phosphatase [Halomonas eurihalina]MDR5860092.1 D-glycero-beta-D-manno-heptose 1,7-bisphosphate 7-phosphatase [Halomonas eurihalina]TZG35096.1 D-glycero-beta-D-manno-heptose 1,7-bisphosphate 7-phosphatase [Halomonas eurihalina]